LPVYDSGEGGYNTIYISIKHEGKLEKILIHPGVPTALTKVPTVFSL
jgi:hypothetical protein